MIEKVVDLLGEEVDVKDKLMKTVFPENLQNMLGDGYSVEKTSYGAVRVVNKALTSSILFLGMSRLTKEEIESILSDVLDNFSSQSS